ncbi:MAG: hypothetical protein R3F59_31760 [Myxococcota bacterium]
MTTGPNTDPAAVWRTVRERTAPSAGALHRVRSRLDRQLVPATAVLASLPASPDRLAVQRVRARLRARPEPAGWPVRTVGAALALGAVAMAASMVVGADGEAPRAERYLVGDGTSVLAPHVLARHDGEGTVQTGPDGVTIDWELGRLELDVMAQDTVAVHTAEGDVHATGTALAVERDALGTRVAVSRGEAELTCAGGAADPLGAGASAECLPTTAAGLLNRARAQQDAGDAPDALLATVARGLAASPEPAVAGELLALQVGALVSAGRDAEALTAAETAVQGSPDPARAASLRRTGARLALRLGACDRAEALLEGLDAADAERALLARCGG